MRLNPGFQIPRNSRFFSLALGQLQKLPGEAVSYPRLEHNGAPMRIPEFRNKYAGIEKAVVSDEEVTLHGRIESVRVGGKLIFIDLKSEFERIQGVCNLNKFEDGTNADQLKRVGKVLKRGDIISLRGKATRTTSGELSIQATRMPRLLAPSILPLPTTLKDQESRRRNRHVDMLVNPKTVDILRLRSYLIKYLRDFLHERHFLEFQTPILAGAASGATARPFTVTANAVSTDRKLSLRIAPELWLKRLVVGGVDRVFELGPAFRNEGIDQTHNPEFTICEFYQAYSNLSDLISLTQDLIRGLAAHCQSLISTKLTSLPAIDLTLYEGPFEQAEFIPTLESALGFKLPDLDSASALIDLLAELKARNIPLFPPSTDISTNTDSSTSPTEGMTLPWLLDKLAERYIEPLSAGRPLFITHHPECMSPLAKSFVCDKTGQTVSARAELFVGGRELANMYEEENHPGAQHAKFLGKAWARTGVLNGGIPDKPTGGDRGRTEQGGLEAEDGGSKGKEEILVGEGGGDPGSELVDQSYIRALCSGLPPTGGWGCGVERLVMLFAGTNKIGHCLSFGSLRDVVGTSSHDPRGSLFPAEDEQKHRTRRGRRKEVS